MPITRATVARKLAAYLHYEISLHALVDWAQLAMMEGEFEGTYDDVIRDAVARLGLADIWEFGLTWEDWEAILKQLGYGARIEIVADWRAIRVRLMWNASIWTASAESSATPLIRGIGSWPLLLSGTITLMNDLQTVILTIDLPDHGLKSVDWGTVILVHRYSSYEVELMTLDGETMVVPSLSPDQVLPVGHREIAHARLVTRA